jgi:hypothetical protein
MPRSANNSRIRGCKEGKTGMRITRAEQINTTNARATSNSNKSHEAESLGNEGSKTLFEHGAGKPFLNFENGKKNKPEQIGKKFEKIPEIQLRKTRKFVAAFLCFSLGF